MSKKILIGFDGTGHDMGDAEDDSLSNIAKIATRAGWVGNDKESNVQGQKVLYYPGPGTRDGFFRRLVRTLMCPEKTVARIIHAATADLQRHCHNDDQITIIGFSRGAAIARRFASLLDKGNITLDATDVAVKAMICFDTVAQIGMPDRSDYPDDDVVFENNGVSKSVEQVYHLVAIDEDRGLFPPTLMDYEEGDRVQEIWFRGVHSDVGGGYNHHGLSDVSLEYSVQLLKDAGVKLQESTAVANYPPSMNYMDIHCLPDPFAPIHTHKISLRHERQICVIDNGQPNFRLSPKVHESVFEVMSRSRYLETRDSSRWDKIVG